MGHNIIEWWWHKKSNQCNITNPIITPLWMSWVLIGTDLLPCILKEFFDFFWTNSVKFLFIITWRKRASWNPLQHIMNNRQMENQKICCSVNLFGINRAWEFPFWGTSYLNNTNAMSIMSCDSFLKFGSMSTRTEYAQWCIDSTLNM